MSSFAAWALGDVSGVPGPASPQASTAGGTAARAAEPGPRTDPAELLAQQLRAARQSGYQDGYRDGLVALEGFKQSFAAQTTTQIGVLVASVHTELDALQQQMARSLAGTAIALSRQIVRSELSTRPECVALVAEQAIEALEGFGVVAVGEVSNGLATVAQIEGAKDFPATPHTHCNRCRWIPGGHLSSSISTLIQTPYKYNWANYRSYLGDIS